MATPDSRSHSGDSAEKSSDLPNEIESAGAEEELWRPLVDGLRSFLSNRVPAAHVDDVVQETLLRLHESISSLDDPDRVEAWVFTIARRTIADFYRGQERRPVEERVERPDEVMESEETAEAANLAAYDGEHDVHEEVLSWLRPMVEELPEMYRRPLVMADFEGHTQQEVADELGLSLSGAKSRVQRARDKLGDLLRQCCELEFGREGRARAFRRRSAST